MSGKNMKEDTTNYDVASLQIISDFTEAVKGSNVSCVFKIQYTVNHLHEMGRFKLQNMIQNDEQFVLMQKKAEKVIQTWRSNIAVSDTIDVFSPAENKWFESSVLSIDHAKDTCRVHYIGWNAKFDSDLVIAESLLCPAYTFSKSRKISERPAPKNKVVFEEIKPVAETVDSATLAEVDGFERGSRSRRTSTSNNVAAAAIAAASVATSSEGNVSLAATDTVPETKDPKPVKDVNDWICGICGLLESKDGSDLVLCEATCLRSFHLGCMAQHNMPGPTNDVDTWFCPDCRLGSHKCFICNQRGADYQDVHKCNFAACGKYYHHACLQSGDETGHFIVPQINVTKKEVMRVVLTNTTPFSPVKGKNGSTQNKKNGSTQVEARSTRGVKLDYKALNGAGSPNHGNSNSGSSGSSSEVVETEEKVEEENVEEDMPDYSALPPSTYYTLKKVPTDNVVNFKCPLHVCFNCFAFYGAKDTADLNKCVYCPRSFHSKCVVPGSRFNSRCVVCPLHPTKHLPPLEVTQRILKNEFSLFWEQLAIPDVLPDANDPFDNHFKLQCHIKESYSSEPVNFKMISRNDWEFMQSRNIPAGFVPEVACECSVVCDEHCLNRILRIECCDCKSGGRNSETNSTSICNIGANCTNRAIQQRKYAKTEAFREFQMGWGLRSKEAIRSGALIMEYVGEVIDYAEVHRRMSSQKELTPMDRDFYIMELDNGLFVDGKYKGSNSRFINHSCDPNCELQRWVVKGSPRIGIFAIKDIQHGEPLSYDYQFDTKESESFKCYCGTAKCRGTMAPTKKGNKQLLDANGRPQNRGERQRLVMLGREKELLNQDSSTLTEAEWSRSYTSKYVPGDLINEIKNGPVKAAMLAAQRSSVALCRTVKLGSNFFERKQLLAKSSTKLRRKLQALQGSKKKRSKPVSSSSNANSTVTNGETVTSKRPRREKSGVNSAYAEYRDVGLTIDE